MKIAEKVIREIKKIRWGSAPPKYKYSNESVEWIKSNLKKFRKEVAKKNKFDKGANDSLMMYSGDRFTDDARPVAILQANLKEDEFQKDKEAYLKDVLKYLAETDYYYKFEKEF